jgi:hypothetical protein
MVLLSNLVKYPKKSTYIQYCVRTIVIRTLIPCIEILGRRGERGVIVLAEWVDSKEFP